MNLPPTVGKRLEKIIISREGKGYHLLKSDIAQTHHWTKRRERNSGKVDKFTPILLRRVARPFKRRKGKEKDLGSQSGPLEKRENTRRGRKIKYSFSSQHWGGLSRRGRPPFPSKREGSVYASHADPFITGIRESATSTS